MLSLVYIQNTLGYDLLL